MKEVSRRLVEVDFLRGLALLCIVVDHIGGSIVSRFTLHAFAYCDAAEVFVFLAGFSAATAYARAQRRAIAGHAASSQAGWRLVRRAATVYRGFLLCSAAMLCCALVFRQIGIGNWNMAAVGAEAFAQAPLSYALDVVLLRRQPYLAGVLPMYVFFLLAAPVLFLALRRHPGCTLAASTGLWLCAPMLAVWLPGSGGSGDGSNWDFNPFAWQLVFVLGAIAQRLPAASRLAAGRQHGWLAAALLLILLAFAACRIFWEPAFLPVEYKQTLAVVRVANFLVLAWLVAYAARAGWIATLAAKANWIAGIGRNGLPCFVAGAVISLVIDSILYWSSEGRLDYAQGLLADICAVAAMAMVAAVAKGYAVRASKRAPA